MSNVLTQLITNTVIIIIITDVCSPR